MRRFLIMIFILLMTVLCWSISYLFNLSTITTTVILPTSTETHIPPTPTVTKTQSPTYTPIPSSTATVTPLPLKPFTVLYHPDDVLYVGDQVSLEVISPPGLDVKDSSLQVQVDPPDGQILDPISFATWGIQGRNQATLLWSWDTQNLEPGEHTLEFSVLPSEYSWTEQVRLLASNDMPPEQAEAQWASTQTECCTVFYITNTASERDIFELTSLIDEQAALSVEQMGSEFTQPITITVLPRLLGHGGFASDEISVSYLDRNYAANSWEMVVHHEMIHDIDRELGGDFRPTIFVEGLAVYMSGGHYKPEPLMPRAAALMEDYLNWYIPLEILADDFYASQHEIGYLEGASLIEYMIRTYGWDAFSAFYRDIHINQGESQSDAIDRALLSHFAISFSQLEQNYRTALSKEPDISSWLDDVHLTVTYFDTMRRYQQLLDPSAYFRTAWLMDNQSMRDRNIVADYLRHPHTPQNLALETLFKTASDQMSRLQFSQAEATLESINSVLDSIERGIDDPFSVSVMTIDYLSIATILQLSGYDVHNISINEDVATVSVSPPFLEFHLVRSGDAWTFSP